MTVSRFVPRLSISASRFAWLDADTPTTATIAPIPIAIPRADSDARRRRVRRPWNATENSSCGGIRAALAGPTAGGAADGAAGRGTARLIAARPRTISPSRICRRRGNVCAMFSSCVISTSVAPSAASSCNRRDHLAPGPRVEVAGRLVGEDDLRALGDRARDRDPLALAARQLRRPVGQPVPEPDTLERGPCGLPAIARRRARVQHAGRDVLDRVHRVLEMKALEHEPDLVRAQPRQLDVRQRDDVVAEDLDHAAGRPLERAEHRQHRRLAGARRSDDRDPVTDRDLDRDARQRVHATRILLGGVLEAQRDAVRRRALV